MSLEGKPRSPAVILACSPRPGGNSDAAAELLASAAAGGGNGCEMLRLRDFTILPCRGCNHCGRDPESQCLLAGEDQAEELFARLLAAPWVVLCSPIYFYHLPGAFKGFIDRAQRFYRLRERLGPDPRPRRRAHAVLVAGRPRGERLFEGSVLTLKYFLDPLGLDLERTVLLRGIDGPGSLRGNAGAVAGILDLAEAARGKADGCGQD